MALGKTVPDREAIRAGKKPRLDSPSKQKLALKPQHEPQDAIDEDLIYLNKEEAQLDVEQEKLVKQLLTNV